jgi:hypothetical protein
MFSGIFTQIVCAAFVWPTPGDVVVLAFDRQQRDIADRGRIDRLPRCIISPFGSACLMNT